MQKIPASTGWSWLKQGFAVFRKQPGGLTTLFLGYMFLMLLAGVIPLLGSILPIVLVPVFSVAFMQACVTIEQRKRVLPTLLGTGFHKPAFAVLATLGVLYLITAVAAVGISALADDGVFWQVVTGQMKPQSEEVQNSNIGGAIFLAILVYIPAAMAFCFAAPLIFYKQMGLGKAVFYSFFAVWRALGAFAVFAISWFALSVIASQIVLILFGRSENAMIAMLPVSVILTVIMHCSLYAAYKHIFGAPAEAVAAPEIKPPL